MSLPWNYRRYIQEEISRQLEATECDPCKNGGRTLPAPKLDEVRYRGGVFEVFNGQRWVATQTLAADGGSSPSANTGFPYSFPIQF